MRIDGISIRGFRNIAELNLSPSPGVNVIFGDNAQGKTNLVEAIWLFSGAKSFRGSRDAEFIKFGEEYSRLEINFSAAGRSQSATIAVGDDRKTATLNGVKLESQAKLAGEICCVVFSPDDLSLVKQGPEKRRRMIDTSLCQAYPKFIKALDGFQKILKQRNRLLKDLNDHPELLDTLEVWDKNLVDIGSYVASMRARYIKKLAELAAGAYRGISWEKEELSAVYSPGFPLEGDGSDRESVRRQLQEAVLKNRGRDIESGITEQGPHRDDVDIRVNGVSARLYGSQGQQRSCVLALKLAECGILEERNQEPPVILLDDVMSELDHFRRDYLLNRLGGKQVFITCCDASAFATPEGGMVLEMRNGRAEPCTHTFPD